MTPTSLIHWHRPQEQMPRLSLIESLVRLYAPQDAVAFRKRLESWPDERLAAEMVAAECYDEAKRGEPEISPHQCSWCNRFYLPSGEYVPSPFIAVNVSHGICPQCYQKKHGEIQEMRKRARVP